ncbi:hypothetical protein AOLI_G00288580 [Acnodon oligacanthus]
MPHNPMRSTLNIFSAGPAHFLALYMRGRSCAPARVISICQDSNMEQASPLYGGVSLLHTVVDGEHHYKVKKVLTDGQSTFARKGDKILMINDVKTKDLPPEEFSRMLCSRSPSLTIHQESIDTGINECLECDGVQPYRKEEITLHFRMAMVREECLEGEENGLDPAVCEWESDYAEDGQELLLVSMNETSVAVRTGRGCDPEKPCNSCGSHGCNLNEVVVATKTCEVTSVGRDYIRNSAKKQYWMRLVQEFKPHNFLSVEMTIYYYITNILSDLHRGVPVVLNLTGSTDFLKCTLENDKVVLKFERCDQKQMEKVCKDDEEMWPFVFYMKTLKDNTKQFESAAHRGWFIQTTYPKMSWYMEDRSEPLTGSFYFVISYKPTSQ